MIFSHREDVTPYEFALEDDWISESDLLNHAEKPYLPRATFGEVAEAVLTR